MDISMDKFTALMSSLSIAEDKSKVLEEVQPALSRLSREEATSLLNSPTVNLAPVFQCLQSQNDTQIEIGCQVLSRLLTFMDPALVVDRYGDLMTLGLKNSSEKVVLLILAQLYRCSLDDDLSSMLIKRGLLGPIVDQLRGEVSISLEVTKLLTNLADTEPGLSAIFGKPQNTVGLHIEVVTPVTQQLVSFSKENSVLQIRVLEVAVKVAVLSQQRLKAVKETGLLADLIALVSKSEDCLAQLAGIEILSLLAVPPFGSDFLEASGVLDTLARQLEQVPNDPFSSVLLPGLVKFFGNLAHSRPRHILVRYPAFISSLSALVEDQDDLTGQAVAFETIGFVGESVEGKQVLGELGNKMLHSIDCMERLMTDGPTEMRIRAMNAFASLVRLEKENQSQELLSLTESWFRRIPKAMFLTVNVVKQPFLDLRLAAYQLLQVLAKQSWGRKEILRQPGFLEYLLDRENEREKRGKEEKFLVLETIVDSGEARDVVGEALDMQLRLWVREGPHFVKVESQVATEGV